MMDKKTYTVMVIEDEFMLLQAITMKFKKIGVEAISCTTGEQALDYLKNLPKLPDAIWLDFYLTDMNGLDFVSKLKAEVKFSQIPVIVVSNSASDEKLKTMLALGVNKYILKADYRLEEIVAILETMIRENL